MMAKVANVTRASVQDELMSWELDKDRTFLFEENESETKDIRVRLEISISILIIIIAVLYSLNSNYTVILYQRLRLVVEVPTKTVVYILAQV